MGTYKNRELEKGQIHKIMEEAEKAAQAFLQPSFGSEFSDYPANGSLLDIILAFNRRKAEIAA